MELSPKSWAKFVQLSCASSANGGSRVRARAVCRCGYSVPACVLMYSVCCLCFMLNNILSACEDTVHIMVQFLSAVFLLRPRWYELCCRSESSLSLAHCLQIVMGLYGLTHAKTVGGSFTARQNTRTHRGGFFFFIQVFNKGEFHSGDKYTQWSWTHTAEDLSSEKNNFSALMLCSLH